MSLWTPRMRGCFRCDIFNRKKYTCGTLGETFNNPLTGEEEQLGCLCWMPVKAKNLKSNCWIYDVTNGATYGIGWKINLNGTRDGEYDELNGE